MYYGCFLLFLFLDNIILHTSKNNVSSLWIRNHHQKYPLYQILLLFNVDLPPQCMKLPLVLIIILGSILPVLISIILNHDILLHLEVRVSLFSSLFLGYIHQYILNKK